MERKTECALTIGMPYMCCHEAKTHSRNSKIVCSLKADGYIFNMDYNLDFSDFQTSHIWYNSIQCIIQHSWRCLHERSCQSWCFVWATTHAGREGSLFIILLITYYTMWCIIATDMFYKYLVLLILAWHSLQ